MKTAKLEKSNENSEKNCIMTHVPLCPALGYDGIRGGKVLVAGTRSPHCPPLAQIAVLFGRIKNWEGHSGDMLAGFFKVYPSAISLLLSFFQFFLCNSYDTLFFYNVISSVAFAFLHGHENLHFAILFQQMN